MTQQGRELIRKIDSHFESMVPDETVRLILVHSLELFARKGLQGTKISDIAQHAGFSQGFVYHYFKSKEEIFTKIVGLAADGAETTVKAATAMEGTCRQRLEWLTEALLSPDSLSMQHWRFLSLQATMSDAMPPGAKAISAEGNRRTAAALLPVILEGQRSGEFVQGDAVMLVVTYFAFVQGLGILRAGADGQVPFPESDTILSFLIQH